MHFLQIITKHENGALCHFHGNFPGLSFLGLGPWPPCMTLRKIFVWTTEWAKASEPSEPPPHPSGRDKSGPYNTRNKLPYSMQEMQSIGESHGPSFFWVVVNCPPYRKAMYYLRCVA